MLWSLVLPFLVTCCVLTVAVIGATVAAPRIGWRRERVFGWGALVAMVAFVPSCTVVMKAINAIRLGVGQYDDVDAIWDRRFKRWLPESATDIVMQTHLNGYHARFKIDRNSLDEWFDRCWANAKEKAAPRTEPTIDEDFDPAKMEQHFGRLADLNQPAGATWMVYEGPRRSNLAGATTWINERDGIAYQDVGFW